MPQRYVYTNGLTMSTALKMAKGVTLQASTKVQLTRKGEKPVTFDRKSIEQGVGKELELQPGDRVFVPRK